MLSTHLRDSQRRRGACVAVIVLRAAIAAALISLSVSVALAQPALPAHDFNAYEPTGSATRIDLGEAPTIDGDLSDPVWAKAQAIDEFYQVDPVAGALPSERTVVRFLYDSNTLYIGVYAYDREPDKLIA